MNRYHNLTQMLVLNHTAHWYFDNLPDYVRTEVVTHGECLHSCEELQSYAEKIMHGNGF